MGYYVQTPRNNGKALQLVNLYGAEIINEPSSLSEIPEDKALICVVQNGPFDAALYCWNESELKVAKEDKTGRRKTYVIMDKARVHRLVDFKL